MIGYKILTGNKTACYGFRDDYEQAKDLLKISQQNDIDATIEKYEYESLAEKVKHLEAENAALRTQLEQPDNKPLMLDELREISTDMEARQWVWIEDLIPFDCREKESGYYRAQHDYTRGEGFVCGHPGTSFSFEYAGYGVTWLAYRRKPAADGEKG